MRNKVQLYIGGKRADLDDGSFILFTYTAEELTNPPVPRCIYVQRLRWSVDDQSQGCRFCRKRFGR